MGGQEPGGIPPAAEGPGLGSWPLSWSAREEMLLAELTHSCRARQRLGGWTRGRLQHIYCQRNTMNWDFPHLTNIYRNITGENQSLIHSSKPPRLQE